MLKLSNVEVKYAGVILAVRGVTLEVPDGQIVALVGSNGAGKSSTLKAISGMLKIEDGAVTDGSISFDGARIDKMSPQNIVKLGVTQIPEGRRILQYFSVEENLKAGGLSQPASTIKDGLERVYSVFPRLAERRSSPAGFLSGGEQQMLVVGRAMMSRPKCMLIDEASLGLSPIMVRELFGMLERLNQEQKISILLVEQNVKAALEISDHGYVLQDGKVVFEGSAEKLRNNEDIKEFYMGLSATGERRRFRDVKRYKRKKRWTG